MFYDERINNECGRIYKRGIIYAVLVTLIYGVFRSLPFIAAKEYNCIFSILEAAIILCGAVILIIDFIKFKGLRDERTVFERHGYYLKCIKVFLGTTLAAYVVAIPTVPKSSITTISPNHLLLILQVLGYVYTFYSFKSRDINFNYSFVAEEKRAYYSKVFKNIGGLCVILFVAFFFSAMLDFWLHKSFISFFLILRGYLLTAAGASLEYIFISFVEKISYDDESHGLNKGTVISGCVYIFFSIGAAILNMICVLISVSDPGSFEVNFGEILAYFTTQRLYMGYVLVILSAIALCHFLTQTKRSGAIKRIILTMLSLSAASVIIQFVQSFIFAALHSERFVINLITIANWISGATKILSLFLIFALAYNLNKRLKIGSSVYVLPIAYLWASIISIFSISQQMFVFSTAADELIRLIATIFGLIVLSRSQYPEENE